MRVSIVAVVAFFAAVVAANGGFVDNTFGGKCKYLTQLGGGKKDQTSITAWCLDKAGKRWQTTINLNRCIGNKRGKLVWRNNPDDNVGLKCACSRRGKKPKYTELALSPYNKKKRRRFTLLKLKNGRFVCGVHLGDKTERRVPDETGVREPDKTERGGLDKTERMISDEMGRREPDKMERGELDKTEGMASDEMGRREPDKTERTVPDEMGRGEQNKTDRSEHNKTERGELDKTERTVSVEMGRGEHNKTERSEHNKTERVEASV
ncbi:hypothetical protein BM221_006279 [Beauveria bassiana]|uniref:Cyanovirin-N domain-containing protein n=1 Tax=Beauveria bassiana TaxID=176275 RepID=A0A2N6NLF3_BEABA|nr:hypothetical protein BM221_006279 [Beauveria bassiana]